MRITCEITNLPEVLTKLNTFEHRVELGMEEISSEITHNSLIACHEHTPVASGEIKSSYQFYTMREKAHSFGRLWNSSPDVFFVHYGTGIYAEKESVGDTPTFLKSGHTRWYVPPDEFPEYEQYNYPLKTMRDGTQLIQVRGQKPNKFMLDAFEDSKDQNISIGKSIMEEICRTV